VAEDAPKPKRKRASRARKKPVAAAAEAPVEAETGDNSVGVNQPADPAPVATPDIVVPIAQEAAQAEDAPAEEVAQAEDAPAEQVFTATEETAPVVEAPAEAVTPDPAPEPEREPALVEEAPAPFEPDRPKKRGWWSIG
jgi:ribonuclease E